MRCSFPSLLVLTLSCFPLLSGCGKIPARSEEGVMKEAFTALMNNDLAAFEEVSITGSDFVMRDGNENIFARKNSFVGGVQKKNEQEHAVMQFHVAREGWQGYIDYSDPDTKFVGVGKVIWEGDVPHLNGVEIPAVIYSAKIRNSVGEHDDIPPYFRVVKWGDYYRIMGLVFPHQDAGEAAAGSGTQPE